MYARELIPQPRCTIICLDPDQGNTKVQCARWIGHEPADEHLTYRDVLADMLQAIIQVKGINVNDPHNLLGTFMLYKAATHWYNRLVIT